MYFKATKLQVWTDKPTQVRKTHNLTVYFVQKDFFLYGFITEGLLLGRILRCKSCCAEYLKEILCAQKYCMAERHRTISPLNLCIGGDRGRTIGGFYSWLGLGVIYWRGRLIIGIIWQLKFHNWSKCFIHSVICEVRDLGTGKDGQIIIHLPEPL